MRELTRSELAYRDRLITMFAALARMSTADYLASVDRYDLEARLAGYFAAGDAR